MVLDAQIELNVHLPAMNPSIFFVPPVITEQPAAG